MARIRYAALKLQAKKLERIAQAEAICEEYAQQGLSLTLRQVFYQFVARGLLPNTQGDYKALGEALNDGRMAGLLDWDYLSDRTRNLADQPHWESPATLVKSAATQFRMDLWKAQPYRVEVWVEKDAAVGVIEGVCRALDVPFFSCRGYTSASEMWAAGQRIGHHLRMGQKVRVLHIGDHDPSGLDMTRDIRERLATFVTNDWAKEFGGRNAAQVRNSMREGIRQLGGSITDEEQPWAVRRIALSVEQIEQYAPPPNPAKTTDARFLRYQEETGLDESWELDALDPLILQTLIRDHVTGLRDQRLWDQAELAQEEARRVLSRVSDQWDSVAQTWGRP